MLWQHRSVVTIALILSVVGFVVMTFHVVPPRLFEPRAQRLGTATTTVLVDSSRSQAIDVRTNAIAELAYRAELLAGLLMKPVTRDAVAGKLGLPPDRVILDPPTIAASGPDGPVDTSDPRAYVLRAAVPKFDGGDNQIMQITTRAPTPAAAAQLADASVATLRTRVGSIARAQRTPRGRRLVVTQLEPPRGEWQQRGTAPLLNAAVAILAFAFACWLILAVTKIMRASSQERIRLSTGRARI
jgi:hypothetical protein